MELQPTVLQLSGMEISHWETTDREDGNKGTTFQILAHQTYIILGLNSVVGQGVLTRAK